MSPDDGHGGAGKGHCLEDAGWKATGGGGHSSMEFQEKSVTEPALWGAFVVQSLGLNRVRLCNPMDGSTPGFPVLHYLPEFAQTQVHLSQ